MASTNPKTVASYDQFADFYNKHVQDPTASPYHTYYEKPAIRALLPKLNGLRVLNLGCGSGVDSQYLHQQQPKRIVGIDISQELIKLAQQQYPDQEYMVGDMQKLPFDDSEFDVVYASLSLHYLPDWTQVLSQVHRVLDNNSVFIFSCGHPMSSAMEKFETEEYKGARLGRTKRLKDNQTAVFGDYLSVEHGGVREVRVAIDTMEIYFCHRPISLMLKQFRAAGFSVEALVEPSPLPELQQQDKDLYERLIRIPEMMVWSLAKG